jgi:hypothetical protein
MSLCRFSIKVVVLGRSHVKTIDTIAVTTSSRWRRHRSAFTQKPTNQIHS